MRPARLSINITKYAGARSQAGRRGAAKPSGRRDWVSMVCQGLAKVSRLLLATTQCDEAECSPHYAIFPKQVHKYVVRAIAVGLLVCSSDGVPSESNALFNRSPEDGKRLIGLFFIRLAPADMSNEAESRCVAFSPVKH